MRWSGAMIVLSNPRGERKKASPDLCTYVENNATCPSAMGFPVRISSSGSHLGTAGIQLNDSLLQKQNFILTVLKHQNSSRQGSLKANRFGSLSLLLFYLSHLKQVQQLWKFPFSMAEFILIWSWRSRPTVKINFCLYGIFWAWCLHSLYAMVFIVTKGNPHFKMGLAVPGARLWISWKSWDLDFLMSFFIYLGTHATYEELF